MTIDRILTVAKAWILNKTTPFPKGMEAEILRLGKKQKKQPKKK